MPPTALKDYQGKIIALYARQELLIAELYQLFSALFPQFRIFWTALSREELEHAEWVEYFYKKARSGEVRFFERQVKTYTLESFVRYLEEALAKLKQKAPSAATAFALARDIEDSLLEKKVFEHFQGLSADASSLLKNLHDDTQQHSRMIREQSDALLGAEAASPKRR